MTDTATRLASLDEVSLLELHERLDSKGPSDAAVVEAHHLVTTEMARRDIGHLHDGDVWFDTVVLVDTAEVDSPEDIDAPAGMEKAWADALAGGGTVSVLLTVDGYVLKADAGPVVDGPDASSVHVDAVMGGRKASASALSKEGSYAIPEAVQSAAKKALQWISEGRSGDGFTSVGRNRAKQLASGGTVSRSTLVKMRAYLARHVIDKDAEDWGDRSDPTPGMVAWFAWGGDPGRAWANEVLGRVEKRSVPAVITDLEQNLQNRQHAIDEYLYGPMNPDEPGDYWQRLGEVWDVSAEEAATTRCDNCAAFNVTPEIRAAIAEGIGDGGDEVVAAADLGYCELLDFKCASARSCSAWLVGGPIGPDDDDDPYEKADGGADYDTEEQFLASLDAAALAWYGDIGFLIDNDGDPELLLSKAANPEPLRDYWRAGGKGKISWGAGGDFTACVTAVSKYMTGEQAKGYCAIRHREVTGMWPGDKRNRTANKALDPSDIGGVFTLPDGATYRVSVPADFEKKMSRSEAATTAANARWQGPGDGSLNLKPEVKQRVRETLGKGQIAEAYGESYARGKASSKGTDIYGEPVRYSPRNTGKEVIEARKRRDSAAADLMAAPRGSMLSENLAANVVSAQGFIDGHLNAKPSFRRSHSLGEVLGSYLSAGPSGALKSVDHVEKDKRSDAGRKAAYARWGSGGSGAGGMKRSTPKEGDGSPVGSTIDSYPEETRRAIRRKPEQVQYQTGTNADGSPIHETIVKGRDSAWDHLVPDGKGGYRFTPERAAIHEEIISSRVDGKPSQEHPVMVMMGGGGGAGKGTLLKSGKITGLPDEADRVHIDADEIKGELPDYERMVKAGKKTEVAGFTHEESSLISKAVQERAVAQRSHILLDGTGDSSENSLRKKIEAPRDAGYEVRGEYVTAPTMQAWKQNVERAASGPRGLVPAANLVSAHESVSRIVPRMASEFDSFQLWDSSGGKGTQVVIASTTRGAKLRVRDRAKYKTFLDKADESLSSDEMIAGITPEQWTRIRETTQ